MARIVIAEFMDDAAVARLQAAHDVLYDAQLVDDAPRLLAAAAAADALIVRNRTQVRGELLGALARCRVVGRLGVGLDNIDVAGCEQRGMQVIPATGANALSVAEYVIGTAMLLLRGAYGASAEVAAGRWPRAQLSNGRELAGKTLGLVGFGAIGQTTARLARALSMDVIAFDSMLDRGHPSYDELGVACEGLQAVLARADVVSLHVPLVESTRNLIDADRLAGMKPGAVLINTSRGGIVDEAALAQALRSGHLGGAALDVFETEPLPAHSALADVPHLLLTPHVAGVTHESNQRVSSVIADQVLEALARA
ncbi:MAG: hydroxyacid dehydrogenase [Proteobacteria bacterium]|nr:hydroxyacid dehydrogenase [Pseudomonadota bacterium]